jgi:hypothetical protein
MPDELESAKPKSRILGRKFASITKDWRLGLGVLGGLE